MASVVELTIVVASTICWLVENMPEFKLENAIGYAVNRAAIRLKAGLHRAFKANGFDITPEHWAVLNCLWEKEGISQTEIAEIVVKDKTNLTRILDIMERNALISRQDHESDRRSYRIFLTKKAWTVKDRLISIAQEVSKQASRGLSAEEEREIVRLMGVISDNLSK